MFLCTLGECLSDGDDDRRLIFGLLGSNVRVREAPTTERVITW